MALPKKFYFVELAYGEGSKLRYAQRCGGKFTDLSHAKTRLARLRTQGIKARIVESQEIVWTEIANTED